MDLNILGKRRIISDCQRVVKRSNAGAGIEVMFLWWLSFKGLFEFSTLATLTINVPNVEKTPNTISIAGTLRFQRYR